MEWLRNKVNDLRIQKQKIVSADSLDKCRILVFWEIVENGNHEKMDLLWSEEKIYTEKQKTKLAQDFIKIYDDFFVLKNDSRARKALGDKIEEARFLMNINIFIENYKIMCLLVENKGIWKDFDNKLEEAYQLIEFSSGVKINRDKTPEENTEVAGKIISSTITKFRLKKREQEKAIKKEVGNVYKIVASISKVLEIQLNVKDMSVREWLAYEEMAEEMVKSQKAVKNGGKR